MANLKISQKKEGTSLQEFLKKSSSLILLVTIMLLCILPIYFFMLIDLTSENSNIVLIIMTTSLMISIASLALQVITTFKSKGEKKKERFDAEYVQHFFQSVGAYLDGHDNMRASSYKAMAADIYRHIPSKHMGFPGAYHALGSADPPPPAGWIPGAQRSRSWVGIR